MATMEEGVNQSQMKTALAVGYQTLDSDATITFLKYVRHVLPLDGYIFWVKDLSAAPLVIEGSLHYSTDQQQNEDETIGLNRVILTTEQMVQDFNAINSNVMYIGQINDIRFSFNSHGKLYKEAGIYHYRGDAIYPAMLTQIIDDPTQLSTLQVATNSLPIWLSLQTSMPIYPAFLAPANLRPPYATVKIADTRALQSAPYICADSSHFQLVTEKCKVTIYGNRNNDALDFQDFVLNYSLDSDAIGIMNMPIIIDEQRTQSELGILAIKKSIEFEVNYYQGRAQNIARQLILSAVPNFVFG